MNFQRVADALPILGWADLTDSERQELDYLDTPERQESARVIRFDDSVYDLSELELERAYSNGPLAAMCAGFTCETFDSGTAFRYADSERETVNLYRFW